jgi:hypothetical protein
LALRRFELSSSVWENMEVICWLHGHLSCLVAWHKHLSDDSLEAKKLEDAPTQAPLTMLDVVADAFPLDFGLRAFYLLCWPPHAVVLGAVKRRQRYHEHYGEDAQIPFELQAQRIDGA